MDMGDHVTGMISDECIRMGGAVIEKICCCIHGFLCSVGLTRGEAVETVLHGGINGSAVIEEHATYLLNVFALKWCHGSCCVNNVGLHLCSIVWWCV